jgi:hypothetical protein
MQIRTRSELEQLGNALLEPEMVVQELQGLRPQVEPRFDPESLHLGSGRRPDAVKLPDWQSLDEFRPYFGSDDEEPVGLALIRSQFGEELVVGNASRSFELGFGADPCPDFFRDLCRRDDPLEVFSDVEIRLVE